MIQYYYKNELDYAILEILNIKYPLNLRYKEIEQEINLHLESKVPASTLWRHLRRLEGRNVINREQDWKRGPTHYSLKKEFKSALGILKKQYPTDYMQKTLALTSYSGFLGFSEPGSNDEPAIEIIGEHSEDKKA
jgi:DNA-binding HxlR family transcriptional regulator